MYTHKQRFYFNGKLKKTGAFKDVDTLRRWLDNIQRDWEKNQFSAEDWTYFQAHTPNFDPNNALKVTRVSADELIIETTGGHTLRFVNIVPKVGQ